MSRIRLLEQTLIFPDTQTWFANCHASTIVPVGENELLCAFMAGRREAAPDMSIWQARCADGRWSAPERIQSMYRLPHWNPVLHRDGDRLWLYYKVGPSVPEWYTLASYSDDMGRNWSCPREAVPDDHTTRVAVRNKLLVASDGAWIGPCSTEDGRHWDSFVDISRDRGKTWQTRPIPFRHVDISLPGGGDWAGLSEGALWENELSTVLKWDGIIQPTLWESSPGVIHAFMRSTRGSIYRSDSSDGGESWCAAYATPHPNNNSGIDVVWLGGGTIALACNPVSGNWTERSPMSVLLSTDNGATFPERLDVETRNGEYSYPAIISAGNRLHLTYTYNRKSIVHCVLEIADAVSGA